MDFGFNQEQELLRDSARTFLETECPMTLVRQLMEEEQRGGIDLSKFFQGEAPFSQDPEPPSS